jgi:hypothetical protein
MLKRDMRKSTRAAFAEGTQRNLRTQWKTFLLFCTYFQFSAFPVDATTLCLYAQFLSRSFKSVDSIRNYISGVRVLHLFLDLDTSQFDSFQLRLLSRGLKRLNPHCPKQALPITPAILVSLVGLLDLTDPNDSTFWCLFLFAFYLMARKSNLVPTVRADFKDGKFIRRGDVSGDADMLLVKFSWTKTIQFGQRVLIMPLLSMTDSSLCPVKAFLNMIELVPGSPSDAVFLLVDNGKTRPLTYGVFQSTLRRLLGGIVENPSDYSSHSFRRGGASWAFHSGVTSELIQLAGDWRSDAYKLYLQYSLEDKVGVCKKMQLQMVQDG